MAAEVPEINAHQYHNFNLYANSCLAVTYHAHMFYIQTDELWLMYNYLTDNKANYFHMAAAVSI